MPNANENKEENVYDMVQATSAIFNFYFFIFFCIRDWDQKVIPSKFREGQRDYYAKKGVSLHVDVLI